MNRNISNNSTLSLIIMLYTIFILTSLANADNLFFYTSSPSSHVGGGETVTVTTSDRFDFDIMRNKLSNTIKAYETAIKYRVAEVTTAATFQIGELYRDFAKALMKAPAPKGISGEALEQYRLLLEDQAFPIEERSIEIHVANVKQIKDGIYDKWVKDSLKMLRKLQPARYAKDEKVQNHVEAIH